MDRYFAVAVARRDDGKEVVVACVECQHAGMAVGTARMFWLGQGITAAVAFRTSVSFDGYATGETLHWFGSQPQKIRVDLAALVGPE